MDKPENMSISVEDRKIKRILKEFGNMNSRTIEEVRNDGFYVIMPNEDNLLMLHAFVTGPSKTPYENAEFEIKIDMTDEYPFKPPKMFFQTKIWHPNISSVTGAICLDILSDKWVPSMTLYSTLTAIRVLMNAPEPNDPQDAVVARQFLSSRLNFNQTAKFWTFEYANRLPSWSLTTTTSATNLFSSNEEHFIDKFTLDTVSFNDKLSKLIDNGILRSKAIDTLSASNWSLEKAFDDLEITQKAGSKRSSAVSSSTSLASNPIAGGDAPVRKKSKHKPSPKKRKL